MRARTNANLLRLSKHVLFSAVLVFVLVSVLAGCGSRVKPEQTVVGEVGHAEGQWVGKALLKNLKTSKSNTLSVDLLAREPSQLRMEIGAAFGVHIASIALNNNEVRCALTQQKKFITAAADASALARVIPVKIPPASLMAILFERPLLKSEWKCDDYGFTKLPAECSHRKESLVVKWISREGLSRRLRIATPDTEIELKIDQAKSKVQLDDNTFVIEPPEGFKIEQR